VPPGRAARSEAASSGQSKAIETVFRAIHEGDADQKLLAYQYLQMLPQIAQGESNKLWIIPSEFNQALGRLGASLGVTDGTPTDTRAREDG
jgi:regulator of protease activity HflC (stomatin/prohibitin superfamily)